MKLLVIGLDGATPQILFRDGRLENIQRLMEMSCYGPLQSVFPSLAMPAWACMATSQDPGQLGIYGPYNRTDYSYSTMSKAHWTTVRQPTIWEQIARTGKQVVLSGAIPGDESSATRTPFELARQLLTAREWDYFQFVDAGIDHLQHAFWHSYDPDHAMHRSESGRKRTIPDYYRYVDQQIGEMLELLSDDTTILIVSEHGAEALRGTFGLNEWLISEGLLVLNEYPHQVSPFSAQSVNWGKTQAWACGGACASIFLNVEGREPCGAVAPVRYEALREDITARLMDTIDGQGRCLEIRAYKPETIYRESRNIPPDLLVDFSGCQWRSVGHVGYRTWNVPAEEVALDSCSDSQSGCFILTGPGLPQSGELKDAHLLDITPTLLSWAGYEVPSSMAGRSFLGDAQLPGHESYSPDEEQTLRERLSGLGYI